MKTETEIDLGTTELSYLARMGSSIINQMYVMDNEGRHIHLDEGKKTEARIPYKKHQDLNPLTKRVLDGLVKRNLIEQVEDEKDPFLSYKLTNEGLKTLNDLVDNGVLEKVPQGSIPYNGKFDYRIKE